MKNTDATIVFGGGLKNENGKWRTANFNEGDNFGALGDRLRVIAASFLYKNNPDLLIVASGGKGQYKNIPDVPPVALVIKNELIELGVPAKNIVLEIKSKNTYEQLQILKKSAVKNKWKNISIISNQYHLPRIRAMIKVDKVLNNMFNKHIVKLSSAEKITMRHESEKWKSIIEKAYKSEAMKKRIKLERAGVKQIKNGTYNLKK